MKISLEEPFRSRWSVGYLRVSSDGRKRIDLVNNKIERTTISFAKYIVSVNLGRFLDENEEVDHINNIRSDDRLENLQILTQQQHRLKTASENSGRLCHELRCPCCRTNFIKPDNQFKIGNKKLSFCSRKCNGKFGNSSSTKWVYKDDELISLMAEEQILRSFIRHSVSPAA